MSINFYEKLAKDRKVTTIKFPKDKEQADDWEYVITHKDDVKKLKDSLAAGTMKDMKTILFSTRNLILGAKDAIK